MGGNPITRFDPLGLSKLFLDTGANRLTIQPDITPLRPMSFPASNRAKNPSADPYLPEGYGPLPLGTFSVGDLKNTGQDPNSSFGSFFVPIKLPIKIPYAIAREGVGLHAGRKNSPRGPGFAGTLGCGRTVEEVGDYLRADPPTSITVFR